MCCRMGANPRYNSTNDRLSRAIEESKDIWRHAIFPERVASGVLAEALSEVEENVLVARIIDSSDDFRADHNDEIIAAARALLRKARIDEYTL